MKNKMTYSEFLVAPQKNWTGVFTIHAISLIVNLIASIIALLLKNIWLIGIMVVAILLIARGLYLIQQNTTPLFLVPEDQKPKPHRGLIVLVGIGRPKAGEDWKDQAVWSSISYHLEKLEVCWLIATSGKDGSYPYAQEFKKMCEEKGVTAYIHTVADGFSVQEMYEKVQTIYRKELPATFTQQDVIADFTGGVKPMSIGMALACGSFRSMQYMYGHSPEVASEPRLVEFRPN